MTRGVGSTAPWKCSGAYSAAQPRTRRHRASGSTTNEAVPREGRADRRALLHDACRHRGRRETRQARRLLQEDGPRRSSRRGRLSGPRRVLRHPGLRGGGDDEEAAGHGQDRQGAWRRAQGQSSRDGRLLRRDACSRRSKPSSAYPWAAGDRRILGGRNGDSSPSHRKHSSV